MLINFLYSTLIAVWSLTFVGHENNVLIKFCNIGDDISAIERNIYCEDSKGLNQNLSNCSTKRFRYFPSQTDSAEFPAIKFNDVLIVGNSENIVQSIWLMQTYYPDSLIGDRILFNKDYNTLKNYLNQTLKVVPEKTIEKMKDEGKLTGLLWRSEFLVYHLKVSESKTRSKQTMHRISVQIR